MKEFFLHLLNKIEILTGIRQLERLQDKPLQLAELITECVKAAEQFPLKEEILKSVLMDAVSNDADFIGLNVKWVRKILNLYCQVHGLSKHNQKEEVVDLVKCYLNYVSFWNDRRDLDPTGERLRMASENLERVSRSEPPIDDTEAIKIMGKLYSTQIQNTFIETIDNPKRGGQRLKEQFDTIAPLPKREISALEEACGVPEIKQEENEITVDEERTQGTTEATGL
jgi:hypothetical protein